MIVFHKILKKLFGWYNSPKDQDIEETEEYILGWNGILESEKERRKMTSPMLAVRLFECTPNSPAYILFEHELNRRIAYVQAFPAYLSIVMTIVGIFLGWTLAQWKPLESNPTPNIIAEHFKKHNQTYTSTGTERESTETMHPRPVSKKPFLNSTAKSNAQEKNSQPKQQEKNTNTK